METETLTEKKYLTLTDIQEMLGPNVNINKVKELLRLLGVGTVVVRMPDKRLRRCYPVNKAYPF